MSLSNQSLNLIADSQAGVRPSSTLETSLQQPTPLQALSASSSPVAADTGGGLSGVSGSINYTGTAARVVDPDVAITGIDNLNGARVLISNFDASKDRLGIDGVTSGSEGGVTWNYDQVRGTLTLDSSSPVSSSVYQGLLRRVTYENTDANNPGAARTIQFSLGNLLANPENGHFYQFVTNNGISWTDADAAADNPNNKYFGRQGYLTTITSQTEQNFVRDRLSGNGWIGASDAAVEGEWRWVNGPEAGTQFWQGAASGSAVQGTYTNWAPNEPNNNPANGDPNGEDYAHLIGNPNAGPLGTWNDLPNQQDYTNISAYRPQGFIVEFGGLSTDTPLTISANVTLNFGGAVGAAGTLAVGTTTNVPNFTGDAASRPEILWRNYGPTSNTISGANAIWTLDYDAANTTNAFTLNTDPKLTKYILEVKDLGWEIEGLYDIDANGVTDIFWRNYRSGENAVWFMRFDATTGIELDLSRTTFLTPVDDDLSWEMEGVTNFDNTGAPEILWHNRRTGETAIWGLNFDATNNTSTALTIDLSRSKILSTRTTSDWVVEGWADFNKDNVADILWRNYRTGENAIWKLNPTATGDNPYFNATDSYFITQVIDPLWEIADVTDFDRDGVADIVWRNYRTGENAVWGMTLGGDYDPAKTDFTTRVIDPQWVLEGTADFSGDNVPDLLWRNYTSGENAIWRMKIENSKLVFDAGFFITEVPDINWEIEGSGPTRDRA